MGGGWIGCNYIVDRIFELKVSLTDMADVLLAQNVGAN